MNEMLKTKTSEKEETKPTIYVYATNAYGVSIKVGTTVIWYPAREIDCCNELYNRIMVERHDATTDTIMMEQIYNVELFTYRGTKEIADILSKMGVKFTHTSFINGRKQPKKFDKVLPKLSNREMIYKHIPGSGCKYKVVWKSEE